MRNSKRLLLASFTSLFALALAGAPASAQEGGGTIAVGAEALFAPGSAGGGLFVYDAGKFRVEGILGLGVNTTPRPSRVDLRGGGDVTALGLGGRFLYVLHSGQAADFALGGGFGITHFSVDAGDDATNFGLDGVAQLRAFLVPNVALTGTFGLGIGIIDGADDQFVFGGNLVSSAGLAYYFR